jgi:hypothetical protein
MSVSTERTISVTVNGVPRETTVPARRLLSDALRHDLRPHRHARRLRARRLRRVHGARRRQAGALLPDARRLRGRREITTVEG